jgi:uncharacterized membrane protein (DUF485 family)
VQYKLITPYFRHFKVLAATPEFNLPQSRMASRMASLTQEALMLLFFLLPAVLAFNYEWLTNL